MKDDILIDSGTCGENLKWSITDGEDGYTLNIWGEGEMEGYDYSFNYSFNAPWEKYDWSIKTIEISSGVMSIGSRAFSDCSSLTSITISDSVTSIGDWAFSGCSSLTSVTIPDSVTAISNFAFSDCSSLNNIFVDPNNTVYSDKSGILFSKNKDKLIRFPAGRNGIYIVPDSVTSIECSAFSNCSNLTSIIIPDSVTAISYYAFSSCSNLTSITIPDSVTSIGNSAFSDCSNLTSIYMCKKIPVGSFGDLYYAFGSTSTPAPVKCTLYVPQGSISAYRASKGWNTFVHIVEMAEKDKQFSSNAPVFSNMQAILNNPYRTLGIPVNATAREKERQVRKLKQYLEAEQKLPQDDYSFPVIGAMNRTLESVAEAASKLNLDSDRMNAALFWFYKGNEITDEAAFEALKDGDTTTAVQIWEKLIIGTGENGKRYWKTVTKKNASAFHNWFVLEFLNKTNRSLIANLKFLESDYYTELVRYATDETFKITKKDLQLNFLNTIADEIEKKNINLSLSELINLIKNKNFSARQDFVETLAQKFKANINAQIENARKQRTANKADGAKAGADLYDRTKNDLEQIKSVPETENSIYSNISNIADKLANEILQCGIDYFSHYRDSNTDPGVKAMDLAKKAQSLAVGNLTKQRCKENIETIQEWIDDKPEREKQKKIKAYVEFITEQLTQSTHDRRLRLIIWDDSPEMIDILNAKDLVTSCKPKLDNIKTFLGKYDDLYIKLSSAVVAKAQGMIVTVVNKMQKNSIVMPYETLNIIEEALKVINLLDAFDMNISLRSNYNSNKSSLQSMYNQINNLIKNMNRSRNSDGCYIATVAYGSYEHPQVMVLRQFRDNILDKYILGKWFIKIYYRYSPELAKKLKDKKAANNIIRRILNVFIKIIK
jgi:hypothetical protein